MKKSVSYYHLFQWGQKFNVDLETVWKSAFCSQLQLFLYNQSVEMCIFLCWDTVHVNLN